MNDKLKNANQPIAPCEVTGIPTYNPDGKTPMYGLSKREHIAINVFQGIFANNYREGFCSKSLEPWAKIAVESADKLLEELEKANK